jgi:hypothetical protein
MGRYVVGEKRDAIQPLAAAAEIAAVFYHGALDLRRAEAEPHVVALSEWAGVLV